MEPSSPEYPPVRLLGRRLHTTNEPEGRRISRAKFDPGVLAMQAPRPRQARGLELES
jgi:hypothetical protein